MKKKISLIFVAVLLVVLAFPLLMLFSGNQFTVARCIVAENSSLYMSYKGRPVHLGYNKETNFNTGDKLLILHQSAFAESYPEQTRALFVMKLESGTEEDVPKEVLDALAALDSLQYQEKPVETYEGLTENEKLSALKERYPNFFGISTNGGLTVYVWQMGENAYRCYLANTSLEALVDQSFAFEVSTDINEMRIILSSYDIDRNLITIQPVNSPLSSFHYVIDKAYQNKVKDLFWQD